jgi:hypothetical protein
MSHVKYVTKRHDEAGRWLPRATQTIEGVESMAPFFMSLASPSNHWLFLSSLGSLTAGRQSIERSLFPYRTVDSIHDAVGRVGGRTLVRRGADGAVWEPFTERSAGLRGVTRSISRSAWGTWVTLTERHEDFGLEVRQTWTTSHERGVLRFTEVEAIGDAAVDAEIIDGVVDVLPASVDPDMQARLSSLVTAYRMAESIDGLGIYTLGSIPLDRAAPNEALLGTTAWSTASGALLLSEAQIDGFRNGASPVAESRSRGVRGAYLVARSLSLKPGESDASAMALEVHQDAEAVERTLAWRREEPDLLAALRRDADATELALVDLLSGADAVQRTGSFAEDARHYANTLYNTMRGGFPIADYSAPTVADTADPAEYRRVIEDMPLGFSRRHGDPSRPWNRFAIDVRDADGSLKSAYEGNWRDIFQNWEALGVSYPEFLPGFIARFLNASTADGYNPYRIDSKKGLDWEVEDPDDPWSHIGYWGDHQIVYLTRLIERLEERSPAALKELLGRAIYTYADVPYRIAGFDELVADPRNSVTFDHEVAKRAAAREEAGVGKDARLRHGADGRIVLATLEEKLLVPVLAKLSHFVPGAGVWMNTQRPEWNDANNALAGYGASMVTTAALLRHVEVLDALIGSTTPVLSARTAKFLDSVMAALTVFMEAPEAVTADGARRWAFLRAAGMAGEQHRREVWRGDGHEPAAPQSTQLPKFFGAARALLRATLDANRRDDGLFHTYNLVSFADGTVDVARLPLMLEGQAAVLGSGALGPDESLALLKSLRASDLYRADLGTYLLYPDRELPGLLDRGVIRSGAALDNELIKALLERGDTSVVRLSTASSAGGSTLRFAPGMRAVSSLEEALERLPYDLQPLVTEHRSHLTEFYEESFQHASFTGRSGSFFGYEGLGCTYWHMVSKLALAVQETLFRASDAGAASEALNALRGHYRAIRAGIGAGRSPEEYGAFPSEPYSHSPADGRVRQPGMTGQVKEDLLSRLGEVGIRLRGGRIYFDSACVDDAEFCSEATQLPSPDDDPVMIPSGAFGITHCAVPFVIHRGALPDTANGHGGRVTLRSGEVRGFEPSEGLDAETSREILRRTGAVLRVEVALGS